MTKAGSKLLTLTEVAERTKISLPTLQRYKKLYQDRIPSQGEGRKQRYPEEALAVFERLKVENLKRRGKPRGKVAAPAARKARGKAPAAKTGRRQRRPKRSASTAATKPPARSTRAAAAAKPAARRRGRSPKGIDAAELLARIQQLEESQKRLERLSSRTEARLARANGKHIAKPASVGEIRKALGIDQSDLKMVRGILKGIR